MIEEPPVLTVHERRRRPTEAQVRALADVPTGFLADAMEGAGALPHTVRHASPGRLPIGFCGPALTCRCGPADVLAVLGALAEVRAGDVMVAATGGWTGSAVIGDRVMGMLGNAGGAGFVTDGLVRDLAGIEAVGLPVMCAGTSPNSPFAKGPGEIGASVRLGDVPIGDGDVIVADESGAVVVPFDRIDATIERARTVRELEEALDARVAEGLRVPDDVAELLASERTRRV